MAQSRQPAQPSSHYLTQAGLAAAFGAIIRTRWPNLTRVEMFALLVQFSRSSASLAAQDYSARRLAAGIRSRFTVPLASPPSSEQFARTLNWVYDDTDAHTVEQRAEAAITRLAVQTGRETTVEAVRQDPKARAWARETRGNCCYFCALLASRGAVYRSELSAGAAANDKFTGDGAFKFHNNCHCVAVPVFGAFEPTADARQWAGDWEDLKKELGRSPTLLHWRRHFEDRDIHTGKSLADEPALSGS